MRLLFWALLGLVAYLAVRRLTGDGKPSERQRAGSSRAAEDMVRCAVCGLNLPKSEALPLDGRWACCAEHARQQPPASQT
ncbi:MAG TPA: PP0621 family protein [Burkholderiaceae bacterium]|nr:PP0621 family protein [Burkholderiaceae bacterium]